MHSFNFILPLVFLAGSSLAADKCPDGSDPQVVIGSESVCCPGIINIDGDEGPDCCVGGAYPSCFPFCSSSWSLTCQTKVPLTASGYTSIVYSSTAAAAEASTTATATATASDASLTPSTGRTTFVTATSTGGVTGSTAESVVAGAAALAFLGANIQG
ncbi:uncharacterized protein TRUGW13939_01830 [Talaromyces rugulosus]|uniref:GPI anchored protein n=1 Tax=Talaromyces rugulosus TaxID=121627 RepID=A0A7H8QMH6_TALRU|nr:uncharacterized protein TRUGW13939_01830 [Talaromyces rugulosus]QKX54741.1 hypothetical protein TRUGW13939_01830 [Talaromyces rugulosus]